MVQWRLLAFKALQKATVTETKNTRQAAFTVIDTVIDTRLDENFFSIRLYRAPEVFGPGEGGAADVNPAESVVTCTLRGQPKSFGGNGFLTIRRPKQRGRLQEH